MSTTYAEIASYKADLASHGCGTYNHETSQESYRDSALKCDVADLEAKLEHINTDPVAEMMDRAAEQAGSHASDRRGAKDDPCDRARWKR
ncbi:hypothetical protein [Caulobacter sp. S45]|uniref:hypothetical protein n=1 Tax=Caulobacter sp. S45 TaxID=1641861 RepID=UPI0015771D40|nr:hypothetical protein [Caulobacter sp. S45]